MNELIVKGITLGLLLSIAVGPILFTIIKQSINNGIRGGLAFVAGVSLSDVCLAVASNFFTEVFNSLLEQKEIVAVIGSIFLISVGVFFLFFKKVALNEEGKQMMKFRKRDYARLFFTGLLMNILNPVIIGFWLATSTTFANHLLSERFLIFSIALALVLASDIAKVLLANKIRERLTLKNILLINRLNGMILIGFGIAILGGILFYGDKLAQ
ncbi:MAG TPA: LysE family transporter [Flavisolibacter sp.]|jgi:threonine/homoserine/homoserine lactone efflux protein